MIAYKQSRARLIFAVVALLALGMLWFQTKGDSTSKANLVIAGDEQTEGAQVYIDSQLVGTMAPANPAIGACALWTRLYDGFHLVDIRKRGFKPIHKEISFKREGYLGVNLQEERQQQAGKKDD